MIIDIEYLSCKEVGLRILRCMLYQHIIIIDYKLCISHLIGCLLPMDIGGCVILVKLQHMIPNFHCCSIVSSLMIKKSESLKIIRYINLVLFFLYRQLYILLRILQLIKPEVCSSEKIVAVAYPLKTLCIFLVNTVRIFIIFFLNKRQSAEPLCKERLSLLKVIDPAVTSSDKITVIYIKLVIFVYI